MLVRRRPPRRSSTYPVLSAVAVLPVAVLLVAVLLVAVVGPASPAGAASAGPDYSPGPREESPFSGADTFCTPDTAPKPVGLAAGAPGVEAGRVSVVLVVPPTALTPAAPTPESPSPAGEPVPVDPAARAAHYAQLVNHCGGINGRRLELRTIVSSGDAATDCAAVTQGGTPFLVVASGAFDAGPCLAQQGVLVVAPAMSAPNSVLATTHGLYAVGSSPEGVMETQVQDLVDHAGLETDQFALVTAGAATPLAEQLRGVVAAAGLRPALDTTATPATGTRGAAQAVIASKVPVVLTDSMDPTFLDALAKAPDPPSVYVFPPTTGTGDAPTAVLAPPTAGALPMFTWTDPAAAARDEGLEPGEFAQMCEAALHEPVATRGTTTTTTTTRPVTPTTEAPPAGSSTSLTSICLAVRLAARGLYLAGPDLTSRAAARAFHNLPYIDNPAPSGTPVPRPGQLVNEPVRRGAHVLVRSRFTTPCPPAKDTHAGAAPGAGSCWVPTSGYDDGGRAVNAALTAR